MPAQAILTGAHAHESRKAMQTMPNDLQTLISAYSRSKILRLGVAYQESSYADRQRLCDAEGLPHHTLRQYAMIAGSYWPSKDVRYTGWTPREDNYLMAHYQRSELPKICRGLPHRTRHAIINRAQVLGVAKERN